MNREQKAGHRRERARARGVALGNAVVDHRAVHDRAIGNVRFGRPLVTHRSQNPRRRQNLETLGDQLQRPSNFARDFDRRRRDAQLAVEDAVDSDGSSGDPAAPAHARLRADDDIPTGDRQIAGDGRVDGRFTGCNPDIVVSPPRKSDTPPGSQDVAEDRLADLDLASSDDHVGAHRRGDGDAIPGGVVVVGVR